MTAGTSLQNVYKMTIYITTMDNFKLVNEAYDEFFTWKRKSVSIFCFLVSFIYSLVVLISN